MRTLQLQLEAAEAATVEEVRLTVISLPCSVASFCRYLVFSNTSSRIRSDVPVTGLLPEQRRLVDFERLNDIPAGAKAQVVFSLSATTFAS